MRTHTDKQRKKEKIVNKYEKKKFLVPQPMSEDFAAIGWVWAATLPGLPGYYAL